MNPETLLTTYIGAISDPNLAQTCMDVYRDPRFHVWPASISHHHAYPGGLLAHTVEVIQLAMDAGMHLKDKVPVDPDILVAAAVFHDFAKIHEYGVVAFDGYHEIPEGMLQKDAHGETTEYWKKSDYLKKIGHISGSTAHFQYLAITRGIHPDVIDAVCHCILSHHGRAEWGSPVEPQTIEAMLLHHADMLSAKFGPTRKSPQ